MGLALTVACPASAAEGEIFIGDGKHATRRADYVFRLRGPWRIERGVMEGGSIPGSYVRRVGIPDGGICQLTLETSGLSRALAPKVDHGMRIAASGGHGKARWYVGPRNRARVHGVAVAAVPSSLLPRTVVTMTLSRETQRWVAGSMNPGSAGTVPLEPTRRQRRTCAEIEADAARGALTHALTSVRVRARGT